MYRTTIQFFILCLLLSACKSKEFMAIEDADMYSLDATHRSKDEAKRFASYISNPVETNFEDNSLPDILIINKRIFKKDQMRSVLDTIQMKNYTIIVSKRIRSITMTSK